MEQIDQLTHILLVTDNEETFFQISSTLNKAKVLQTRLHWSRDLNQATSSLNKKFDTIIFDDNKTTGSILELLNYLKTNDVRIPVIVISDGDSKDHDLRLLRAGVADYLIRGKIRPDFLIRSIAYTCERSNRQIKRFSAERELYREQKINSLGSLAANIAFQLGSNLETLEDTLRKISKTEVDSLTDRRLNYCQEQLAQSQKVIKNLLAFSSPQISIIPNIDLIKLVLDATDFLNQGTGPNIQVISIIDLEEEVTSDLNPNEIKQVLTNLVLNAKESMSDGGLIKVKLSIAQDKDLPAKLKKSKSKFAMISVIDQGTGIPEESLNRLFEPTFTTKNNLAGMGLGLNMALAVSRAHKGDLVVNSKVGEGSTFKVLLPIAEEHKHSEDEKSYRGLVLVIESDPNLIEVCKLYFSAASLDSRVFSNLDEALDWFTENSHKVDLIMFANEFKKNDAQVIELLNSISSDLNIVLAGQCPYSEEEMESLGIRRVVPYENKYLATISWVGEGIECCK